VLKWIDVGSSNFSFGQLSCTGVFEVAACQWFLSLAPQHSAASREAALNCFAVCLRVVSLLILLKRKTDVTKVTSDCCSSCLADWQWAAGYESCPEQGCSAVVMSVQALGFRFQLGLHIAVQCSTVQGRICKPTLPW